MKKVTQNVLTDNEVAELINDLREGMNALECIANYGDEDDAGIQAIQKRMQWQITRLEKLNE